MAKFNELKEMYFERLVQYVPIVARVHGGHHPEFHNVHKLFDQMYEKVERAGASKVNLNEEFKKLREITDNYRIPGDVCETYEAVYKMLEELDKAYFM
ncbi:MAG TPA: iron-sulfur cluster repair di-iron protein, ric [Acholeplasmataceae bacterium]|nr:iron-sulfur cluster repair di-iron protein, ric [Acholeplasmataceae bacterium]